MIPREIQELLVPLCERIERLSHHIDRRFNMVDVAVAALQSEFNTLTAEVNAVLMAYQDLQKQLAGVDPEDEAAIQGVVTQMHDLNTKLESALPPAAVTAPVTPPPA